LTKRVVASLYSEGDLIHVSPWDIAIAQSENAKQNGVKFMFDAEVTGVLQKNGYQIVETTKGPIKTRFIVNAAGRNAAHVAEMAGACDFQLVYNRSQAIVLDKSLEGLVRNVIQTIPSPGVYEGVLPTISGNTYVYAGTYDPVPEWDRENTATRRAWFFENVKRAKRIVPAISGADAITSFVGVRAWNTRDPDEHIVDIRSGHEFDDDRTLAFGA